MFEAVILGREGASRVIAAITFFNGTNWSIKIKLGHRDKKLL